MNMHMQEQCGFDLARMEHKRSYAANQTAIASLELVAALTSVLIQRFGQGFADQVRDELEARAHALNGHEVEDACTATIVSQMANWSLWKPQA